MNKAQVKTSNPINKYKKVNNSVSQTSLCQNTSSSKLSKKKKKKKYEQSNYTFTNKHNFKNTNL